MKTITYAQKADTAAKVKRVLRSCTRKAHLAAAGRYLQIAEKAIEEGYPDLLLNELREAWREADSRIRNKPRYRFDWDSGQWVRRYLYEKYTKDVQHQMAERQRQSMGNMVRFDNPYHAQRDLLGSAFQSSLGYPFY